VEFLNRAFGRGLLTGSMNVLLCLSYVIMLSLYAAAFGSYFSTFFPPDGRTLAFHLSATAITVACVALNIFGGQWVVRSENWVNATKLIILVLFILVGWPGLDWPRLELANWVPAFEIVAAGMIVFLNYEGFELIANASSEISEPRVNVPRAFYSSVVVSTILYMAIAVVSLGHLPVSSLEKASDNALAVAASSFSGHPGFILICIAAMLATASAINATLYGSSRISIILAEEGDLPKVVEREVWHRPIGGLLFIALITVTATNLLDLHTISTMGSAGFLIIFTMVNLANAKLAKETGSLAWVSLVSAGVCILALSALCWRVGMDPTTRSQLWVLVALIFSSLGIEALTRRGSRAISPQRGPVGKQ